MKQYVIDEIRFHDYEKLKAYFDKNVGVSSMEGVYWIELNEDMLTDVQKAHTDCKPFYMAIELEETRLSGELLVRTQNRIRCDCIHYATPEQRNYFIAVIDAIFEKLKIKT